MILQLLGLLLASSVVIVDVYFAGVGMFDRGRTTSTVFAMILLVLARLHF